VGGGAGHRSHGHPGADLRPCVRDEGLAAVDHPAVAVAHRARLRAARVGAGLGLGEAEGPELLAAEQLGQVALPLLVGAEVDEGRDAQADRGLQGDGQRGVAAGDLLQGEAVGDEVAAGTAHALGEGQGEEAEPGHAGDQVVGELAGLVVVGGPGDDLALGEVAAEVADGALLVAELEIHSAAQASGSGAGPGGLRREPSLAEHGGLMTETAARGAAPATGGQQADPRRWIALFVVLTAAFMVLLDISIVNVAIPSIQRNLGASFGQVQLVLAVVLITGGRLGDIYGRKRLFMTGMAGFVLASASCGFARNPDMLVISRVVQGLMAALMFPQVLSTIQVVFPPRERAAAFGAFGAVIGLASIAGPLVGGLLIGSDTTGDRWRWIFLVNLPIGIAALTAACFLLNESR